MRFLLSVSRRRKCRDFTLPGQSDGPIGFLMYPYAETPDGSKDSLDPTTFAYAISSREIV